MKKTILITGSESFVASFLIKKLKKKYKIIGVDFHKKTKNTNIILDIRKPNFNKLKKYNINYIIHLAAISNDNESEKNPILCFETNVIGTLNMLKFANQYKIKNFIFASTQWVYDFESHKNRKINQKTVINPFKIKSKYGLSKFISELNIQQNYVSHKLNSTILRFGIIYGPRSSKLSAFEAIFYKIIDKESVEIGSKETGRNFIHIDDICTGIEKAIKLKGLNILNLEGNDYITLGNLISKSSKILKKKINIIEKSPSDISSRKISNSHAKKLLKWKPKFNLEKGLLDLLKYKQTKNV